MICPRWLVQSSSIGVVAASVVAIPLWILSPPPAPTIEELERDFETLGEDYFSPVDFELEMELEEELYLLEEELFFEGYGEGEPDEYYEEVIIIEVITIEANPDEVLDSPHPWMYDEEEEQWEPRSLDVGPGDLEEYHDYEGLRSLVP